MYFLFSKPALGMFMHIPKMLWIFIVEDSWLKLGLYLNFFWSAATSALD